MNDHIKTLLAGIGIISVGLFIGYVGYMLGKAYIETTNSSPFAPAPELIEHTNLYFLRDGQLIEMNERGTERVIVKKADDDSSFVDNFEIIDSQEPKIVFVTTRITTSYDPEYTHYVNDRVGMYDIRTGATTDIEEPIDLNVDGSNAIDSLVVKPDNSQFAYGVNRGVVVYDITHAQKHMYAPATLNNPDEPEVFCNFSWTPVMWLNDNQMVIYDNCYEGRSIRILDLTNETLTDNDLGFMYIGGTRPSAVIDDETLLTIEYGPDSDDVLQTQSMDSDVTTITSTGDISEALYDAKTGAIYYIAIAEDQFYGQSTDAIWHIWQTNLDGSEFNRLTNDNENLMIKSNLQLDQSGNRLVYSQIYTHESYLYHEDGTTQNSEVHVLDLSKEINYVVKNAYQGRILTFSL